MCLMELPIPTSLVDRSLLTRFHMETKGCFTIEQLYQWTFVTCICSIGIFRQTDLSQEAIRLTGYINQLLIGWKRYPTVVTD